MKKIEFKKKFWCIVTARKNSKSIKRKNLTKINGKELIKYSLDKIKNIKEINKIIITTDDNKIKNISKNYNCEIIHRSKKLAGDKVNSVNVVLDALKKAFKIHKYLPRFFFLIQPTSPFLQINHIKKLITIFQNSNKFKSAQTIIKVPHQFHAYNQRYFKKGLTSFIFEKKRLLMHNKQTKPEFFAYGNLIATNTKLFLKYKNFFLKPSYGLKISNIYGFDVDNKYDLKIIKNIYKKKLSFYE